MQERSSDRILVLKPLEGKSTLSSTGLVDRRLFTGEINNLHAVMDKQTSLWTLKYERGEVPNAFKQKFTSFSRLFSFAEDYFKKRNLEIKEIKD
jgi:hypothetical protein